MKRSLSTCSDSDRPHTLQTVLYYVSKGRIDGVALWSDEFAGLNGVIQAESICDEKPCMQCNELRR